MRVAIIGAGAKQQYYDCFDYDETWGMNWVHLPWADGRYKRRYNLHHLEQLKRDCPCELVAELHWLKENPLIPLYVLERWPDVNSQRIFPREEIRSFGFMRPDYQCCVVSWMIAHAIVCGATKIGLHSISLLPFPPSNQPLSARACVEYWCGVAEGRGVKISVKPDCDLFSYYHVVKSNASYGYDDIPLVETRRA